MPSRPMMSTSGMGSFARLPREMRDAIYKSYLIVEGGYICNSEALINSQLNGNPLCRLKQANGSRIDLALVFTCKAIAAEMGCGGLALRVNTVTFSTFYSDELRCVPRRFADVRYFFSDWPRERMLARVADFLRGPLYQELQAAYPKFMPVVDCIRDKRPWRSGRASTYGEAPSVFRKFRQYVLQRVLFYHGEAFTKLMKQSDSRLEHIDIYHVLHCSIEPWDIPTNEELAHLASDAAKMSATKSIYRYREKDRSKYRFSAASSAICFLRSMPDTKRSSLRKLILNEDREATPLSECHAQGLIPFCQQHPLLRIERRCSLWGNIFRGHRFNRTPIERVHPPEREKAKLQSHEITKNVSTWIMEALVLKDAGMPVGSFSLQFDGDSMPQLCEDIFQRIVQRDAAWQQARQEARQGGYLPAKSFMELHDKEREDWYDEIEEGDWGYFYEDFPRAMEDITNNNSIVRCNFSAGVSWDVEKMVQGRRHHRESQWNGDWHEHEPKSWDTVHRPKWKSMMKEDVVSLERMRPPPPLPLLEEEVP